jgi:hypothetical protein
MPQRRRKFPPEFQGRGRTHSRLSSPARPLGSLREFKKENAELRMRNEFPRKAASLLCSGISVNSNTSLSTTIRRIKPSCVRVA